MANKLLAGVLCLLVLSISAYLWLEQSYFGFPDGHLSELERKLKPLYRLFSVVNLAWFPWMFSMSKKNPKSMTVSSFAYVAFLSAFWVIQGSL